MPSKKYYTILGISENATQKEIKKAYKKEALTWHPDKNQHRLEEANEKFKLIAEAYEILNDPEKRKIYDMYGDEGIEQSQCNAPPQQQETYQNYQFNQQPQQFQPNFGFTGFDSQFATSALPLPQHSFFNQSPFFGFRFHSPMDLFRDIFGQDFDIFGNDLFPPMPDVSNVIQSINSGGLGPNATSTSQVTQIINGKQTTVKTTTQNGQTVTETITVEPDGSISKNVTVMGNDNNLLTSSSNYPQQQQLLLGNSSSVDQPSFNGNNQQLQLVQQKQEQQEQQLQLMQQQQQLQLMQQEQQLQMQQQLQIHQNLQQQMQQQQLQMQQQQLQMQQMFNQNSMFMGDDIISQQMRQMEEMQKQMFNSLNNFF